jgi:hypothetical protein
MKKALTILSLIIGFSQTSFSQRFNKILVTKETRIDLLNSDFRGIISGDTIYFVEDNLTSVSAYKNNSLLWKTKVVLSCNYSFIKNPKIREITISANKLFVVIGKHCYANISTANGVLKCPGCD